MLRKSTPLSALAAFVLAPPAFAHHPSGVSSTGGAGPIATISASTLEAGHSAAAVFFGPHGCVTAQAQQRGVSRQALYRDAAHVFQAVDGSDHHQRLHPFPSYRVRTAPRPSRAE